MVIKILISFLFGINILPEDLKNIYSILKTHRLLESLCIKKSSPSLQEYPYPYESFKFPQSQFVPKKIWSDPEIWKLTKGVCEEYFENPIFQNIFGIAAADFNYKMWSVAKNQYIDLKGEVVIFSDPVSCRLIYHVKGSNSIKAYGSYGDGCGKFKYPQGIEIVFPHVFIADPGNRRVVHLKFLTYPQGSPLPGYPYALEWVEEIKYWEGKEIFSNFSPSDVAFSDNGTPEDSTDDVLYITDNNEGVIWKISFSTYEILAQIGGVYRIFENVPFKNIWLNLPISVAVGKSDGKNNKKIYIAEKFGERITMFLDSSVSQGQPWDYRCKRIKISGRPLSVQTDYWGYVYVTDETHDKIIKIYPDLSDTIWTYGGHGTGVGKFNSIKDMYIKGSEVGVTEWWTENSGISYFWIEGIMEDNIPPETKIISPPDSTFVNGRVPIMGNIEDNISVKGWALYYAKIESPGKKELISSSTGEKIQDTLAIWNTEGMEEGLYYLYLIAEDIANNFAWDTLLLYIGEPYPKVYFGIFGREKGEFRLPCDLVSDRDFIYVCDTQNDRVEKFDRNGNFILSFGKHGKGEGEFMQCNFTTFKSDKLYVSDEYNHRIQVFDSNGNFLFSFGNKSIFNQVGGLDFDNEGNIYVSDMHNHKIRKFSSQGNYITSFGEYGSEPGKFNQPHGIFIHDSLIYIADRQNNRVEVFTLNGKFLSLLGGEGEERGKFKHPYDLVLDFDTSLYVSDQHNNRIQKFDKFGNVLLTIYGDKLPDSLKQPAGLWADDKYLYVADMHKNRVVVYPLKISGGDPLSMFKVPPGGMFVFPNPSKGKIYLVINIPDEKEAGIFGRFKDGFNHVEISVYGVSGRKIGDILKGYYPAGKKLIVWNPKGLSSGTYFLYGNIGNYVSRKKIVFLK